MADSLPIPTVMEALERLHPAAPVAGLTAGIAVSAYVASTSSSEAKRALAIQLVDHAVGTQVPAHDLIMALGLLRLPVDDRVRATIHRDAGMSTGQWR